jgi:serine/threonine protein kinase
VKLATLKENNLMEQMRREIDIHYALRHPRIVRLVFDFSDGQYCFLGMEFVKGGSLFEHLQRAGRLPTSEAARFFKETSDALSYLHHLPTKVIHRDIKPENVLLDTDRHVKLADFGWSNVLQAASKRKTFCGTLDYLAPEMIRGEGHDESLDMWSMGVLLYEMACGRSPFGAKTQDQTCKRILRRELRFPEGTDAEVRDLVEQLLQITPRDRLNVRQALEHPLCGKAGVEAGAVESGIGKSVEARELRKEKERLQNDLERLLAAKASTEGVLMRQSTELDEQRQALQEERSRRIAAEAAVVKLQEQKAERLRTIEELKGQLAGA